MKKPSPVSLVSIFCIFAVVAILLQPAVQPLRKTVRPPCANNLKRIGLALHNYHDDFLSFPPAYVADETGRPMHSWRVLLLPYLPESAEQQTVLREYRFDEPWDGPHNRKLHDLTLKVFRCPSDAGPATETTYVAVVGDTTAWPGARGVRFRDMTDGASNSLLVVEITNSGIHWLEPRDLQFDKLPLKINPREASGISSQHGDVAHRDGAHHYGAHALFGDGQVQYLENSLPEETLRLLLEINDGEELPDF